MSDAPPLPDDTHQSADRSPAAPLFLWLIIQLATLAIAAARVPLSARFPPAGEQFAAYAMIVAQVVAVSLLFPFLLRDAATTLMVILTALPFLQLAAYLSSTPLVRAGLAAAYVAAWIITLALLRAGLRTRSAALLGVAIAVAWSVGGAIVWYASAESREASAIDWSRDGLFGPMLGGVAQIATPRPVAAPWVTAIVLLIISAGLFFAQVRRSTYPVERSGNPSARA